MKRATRIMNVAAGGVRLIDSRQPEESASYEESAPNFVVRATKLRCSSQDT